ncbi:S1/P1 nuclease-domain-containing protein [Phlyctochytrium arcticum]|nr:S1/P1 nuclease-domain-containing protein [Phlyctochytrium arcticum]
MQINLYFIILACFLFTNQVLAYGRVGHWLTGWVAQHYLTPEAIDYVHELLPAQNGSLAEACLWADEIKRGGAYRWANKLHYVNPPEECNPALPKCDICILSAVHNYTRQLLDPGLSRGRHEEALKFLVHFVGDIHQPLHASGRAEGGTKATVVFDGRNTSIHEVWDYIMLEKRIKQKFRGSRQLYGTYLLAELATTWAPHFPSWAKCDARGNRPTCSSSIPVCPEDWASYASMVSCNSVWPPYDNDAPNHRTDLGRAYFENVKDEVELGVMQAGVRMAWVVNALAKEHARRSLKKGSDSTCDASDYSSPQAPRLSIETGALQDWRSNLDHFRKAAWKRVKSVKQIILLG